MRYRRRGLATAVVSHGNLAQRSASMLALGAILVLATCDFDKITSSPPAGSDPFAKSPIDISADSLLTLGGTQQPKVTSTADLTRVVIRWGSSDPAVLVVDSITGVTQAVQVGTAAVTVRLFAPEINGSITRTSSVRVRYKGVKLQQLDSLTGLGMTRAVVANGTNISDALQQPALAGPNLQLVSRDTLRVVVQGQQIVARGNGTARLVAVFDNLRDSILVRVRQVAKTLVLPTTEYLVNAVNVDRGVPLTVRDVRDSLIVAPATAWRVADTNVAIVNPVTGLLRSKRADTTTIFATSDTVTSFAKVRIRQVVASLAKFAGDNQSDTVLQLLELRPTVTVTDSGGTPVPNVPVTFSIVSGGGTVSGTTVNTNSLGRAAIGSWRLSGVAGPHTLRATAGTASVIFGATATAAPPTRLNFETQPLTISVDDVLPAIRVAVRDSLGNLAEGLIDSMTISLAGNVIGATLAGTRRAMPVNGIATFDSLRVSSIGNGFTLSVSAPGVVGAVSDAFGAYGPPTRLGFVAQPSRVAEGVIMTPAVRVAIQDAQGNTVPGSSATITVGLASNPGGATLSGTLLQGVSNSVATFSDLRISKAANGYQLQASAPGLVPATSAAFDVPVVGTPKALRFVTQPDTVVAGSVSTFSISVTDSLGAQVPTATNTVLVALDSVTNGTGSSLTGTTSRAAAAGAASFADLRFQKSGAGYRVVASSSGLQSGLSAPVFVKPGVATRLGFVQQPTLTLVGQSIGPTVSVAIQDANANTVTSASPTQVSLALGGCTGTLSGTTTATTSSGMASFSGLSLPSALTGCNLIASATALTSATSNAFNVGASGPEKLAFVTQPSNALAGATLGTIRVAIQDATNTTVTGVAPTQISLSNTQSALAGTAAVATINGVATFSGISLQLAGDSKTLVASASGYPTATSAPFNVTPGPFTRMGFAQSPTNVTAGAPFNPTVTVSLRDDYGNVVTTATDSVELLLYSGPEPRTWWEGNTQTASYRSSKVAAISGVASFPIVRMKLAGTFEAYSCRCLVGADITGPLAAFTVGVGAAQTFAFGTMPSVGPGQTFSMVVTVTDSVGNPVSSTAPITIALLGGDPAAVLSGVKTVTPVAGVATFTGLSINMAAAGYRLTASAAGLATSTSPSFGILTTATKLGFIQQPTDGAATSTISPNVKVAVQDANGNTVSGSNSITLALSGSGPAGATLTGTVTRTAVDGVATFDDLGITKAGSGYTLMATSTSLASATSSAFQRTPGPIASIVFQTQPSTHALGTSPTVRVAVVDAVANVVTTDNRTISIQQLPGSGNTAALLYGTTSVQAVEGVATFSDLTFDRPGTSYQLRATAPATLTVTSTAFNVTDLVASDGLIGYYPLNGTASDASVNALHGTLVGSPSFTADRNGNTSSALALNGTSQWAVIPEYSTTARNSGTISMWIKMAATSSPAKCGRTDNDFSGYQCQYNLFAKTLPGENATTRAQLAGTGVGVANSLYFRVSNETVATAPFAAYGFDQWHMYTFTWDGANGRTYIDGSLKVTSSSPGSTAQGPLYIGANGHLTLGTRELLEGSVDDIRIYNRVLTASEISTLAAVNAPATRVAFNQGPPATAGYAIGMSPTVQVAITDASGNVISNATDSIHITLSSNPGGASLGGNGARAVAGIASFPSLNVDRAGSGYVLTAQSVTRTLTTAQTSSFSVSDIGTVATVIGTEIQDIVVNFNGSYTCTGSSCVGPQDVIFLDGTPGTYPATTGNLKRVATTGGSITTQQSSISYPRRVISFGSFEFLLAGDQGLGTLKRVGRLGSQETLASSLTFGPSGPASQFVFDSAGGSSSFAFSGKQTANNDAAVQTIPSAGGSATTVANANISNTCLSQNAGYIYYNNSNNLRRVPFAGGTVEQLTTFSSFVGQCASVASQIVVTGGRVYWYDNSQEIRSVAIGGSTTPTTHVTLPITETAATSLVTDGTYIFMILGQSNPQLVRYRISDWTRSVLSTDVSAVGAHLLTISQENVYWVNAARTSILKRRKD